MAAAYLEHLSGGRVDVLSAGSAPAESSTRWSWRRCSRRASTWARRAEDPHRRGGGRLRRRGDDGLWRRVPLLPRQALHEDWSLDDPAGQGLEAVRPIRDEIRAPGPGAGGRAGGLTRQRAGSGSGIVSSAARIRRCPRRMVSREPLSSAAGAAGTMGRAASRTALASASRSSSEGPRGDRSVASRRTSQPRGAESRSLCCGQRS